LTLNGAKIVEIEADKLLAAAKLAVENTLVEHGYQRTEPQANG
jgi:hypothetical protein